MSSKQLFTCIGMLTVACALVTPMAIPQSGGRTGDKAEVLLAAAEHKQLVDGDLEAAIRDYKNILAGYASNHPVAAKALVEMGECYEKLGQSEAQNAYERVLREYADQQEQAAEARTRLAALSGNGATKTSEMVARRVWAGPAVDTDGGPSADGRYLSFVDWETGDLAVRNLATGEMRHVTHKGSWSDSREFAQMSRISPDGTQIAYRWISKDVLYELRVIGVDGSAPRVLGSGGEVEYFSPCAWSSDGKQILTVFHRKDKSSQLALVSVANGSARVLKTVTRGFHSADLSPDGHYIVYDFAPDQNSPNRDIFVLATDGSRESPLVQHPADDFSPRWMPDGEGVVFFSDRSGTVGLWAIRVADGKPQGSPTLVKKDIGRVDPLGFTRNGSFYYGLETDKHDVYTATLDPTTGKVSPPTLATQHFVGLNRSPAWSPDGKYLAYLSNAGGSSDFDSGSAILIRSLVTGEEKEVPLKLILFPSRGLHWSPDGRSLLVTGVDKRERWAFFKIDKDTGNETALLWTQPGNYPFWATWSSDGRSLIYAEEADDKSIRVRDLETGQEKVIVANNPYSGYVKEGALSPDGRRLAFIRSDSKAHSDILEVVPTAGGEPQELLRLGEGKEFSAYPALAWTRDGSQLLFSKSVAASGDKQSGVSRVSSSGQVSRTELWRIQTSGGEPQRLDLAMAGTFQDLNVHPDGKQLAFSARENEAEVWVLENFLPVLKANK